MNIINAESKIYNFDPHIKSISKVNPGDNVEIFTSDASDGQVKNVDDLADNLDIRRANPATGPIEVIGAYPGDILKIEIKAIETAKIGYMGLTAGNKLLGEFVKRSEIKLIPIKDNKVYFNSERYFPIKPMIGVIGTTPNKIIKTNLAGAHGGNMDNRFITTNSIIYLPIFLKGALFAIGDVHAAMGDGEIIGCGVEIAGKIKIRVELLKNISLNFPIVETNKEWIITGEGRAIKNALRVAIRRVIEILINYFSMDVNEALYFLSAYANFGICQSAFLKELPQIVVKVAISNQILNFSKIRKGFEN